MGTTRRPDFYEWALGIAQAVSVRGDCSRRKVGAALFRPDWTLAAVGYNGVPRGSVGCLEGACPRGQHFLTTFSSMEGPVCGNTQCPGNLDVRQCPGVEPSSSYDTGPGMCIAQHAEQNCLANARENTEGFTMFITTAPCDGCVRTMRAHRLDTAVWPDGRQKL